MDEIREVGIEKEMFLLKDKFICEPSKYGFPGDEMGFLIELRSLPSDRAYPVITTLYNEELQYNLRANKFGMQLSPIPFLYVDENFVNYIKETYKIMDFEDFTKNIYGTEETHHLGILKEGDRYRLTSGVHVHFSSRNSNSGEVINLPIEQIVKRMDEAFEIEINNTNRMKGEWEPKKHGFEYRSLPCNVDIITVVKEAFKILRSV